MDTKIELGSVTLFATFKDDGIYVGKTKVAGYWYNSSRSKDNPLCYRVGSNVVNLKGTYLDFVTKEEAMAACEKIAKRFVENLTKEL